jgi:uncharacterized membrane protein
MAHRINPSQNKKNLSLIFWSSFALACLGLLDSIYLLIYKLTGNSNLCLGNGGCHDVNFSPYSEIGGIPVALFGVAAFLAIGGILLLEARLNIARENGPLAIMGISLSGVAFTAYLTWLEIYVIEAICPFCVAAAIIITLIFILSIIRLLQQTAN